MGARRTKYPGICALGAGKYSISARVRVNGRIVARQCTITGTIEQARTRFAELKTIIRNGAKSSLTAINTFGEALVFYLDRHAPGVSKPYFDRLAADLGAVPIAHFADKYDQWFQLMRRSRAQRTGKPISNNTLNHYTTWVKAILNFAVRHGLIEKNPIRHFEKLRAIPRDVVLSDMARQRLLNIIDQEAPHLSAIVRFALQVPCRRSELVNMRRDDLDLFNNCIRVRCGTMKNKEMAAYKPIPPDMTDYFRNLPKETEYLFYRRGHDGKYYPLGDFKRAWRRCLRLAGIEDFHFHDTRHMSATALLNNGTPEGVVCEIAGWTSNAMLKTYYHRSGVQSLKMVRFPGKCEGVCEGVRVENG